MNSQKVCSNCGFAGYLEVWNALRISELSLNHTL